MLLGGPEPVCWPNEGMLVLTGAEGRARADGLLWVWGIGRALCTGLGLGSPDFIFEATRMAGIFSPAAWWLHSPLPLTPRWKSCYYSARILVSSYMIQLLLWEWSCYQIEETHTQFAPDPPLSWGNMCNLSVSRSWLLLLDVSRR